MVFGYIVVRIRSLNITCKYRKEPFDLNTQNIGSIFSGVLDQVGDTMPVLHVQAIR